YAKGSCGTIRDKAGGEGRYGIGHWVMMGSTDRAFAALIDDLHVRGLLAETLVCFVTEFGRTPRLNKFQGRDHWTDAYSIVFAGWPSRCWLGVFCLPPVAPGFAGGRGRG